jgi:hypothetical protein
MYTVLDDQKKAKQVMEYIANNPNTYQKEIFRKCNLTKYRAKILSEAGLITLPPPMSLKQTLAIARSKSYYGRLSVNHRREYGR